MARSVRKIILSGTDGVVRATSCRLIGYQVRETAGSAASLLIYDSNDSTVTADAVIPLALAANASDKAWYGEVGDGIEPGILMESGIYLDFTGAVQGVLFLLDG